MRAGDWRRALRQAAAEANAIGATLEAAIHLSAEPERDLADLVDEFTRTHPPVSMWLVFREGEPATSERTARLARERLDRFPAARIGGGTDRHFAELNRNRPPADLLDAISYSVNPQVHTFDDASLVETFLGQGETVRSARAFSKGREIAVTPITLRPRSHPDPTRRSADPRQATCFGAGWTLGSLASLGCASSVTFYETTGPLGVMGHGSGAVFPLYHVLADAGEFAGGRFVPTISSDSHRVASLALTEGGRFRLLIANLRPDDTIVRIRDLGFGPSVWIRSLDAGSLEEAMRRPQAFRADPGQLRDADPEELEVMLAGHAVARIDVEAEPAP